MLRLPFDRNFNMRLLSSTIKTFISDSLHMKPFIINCLQPNLSKLLVHNFRMQNIKLFGYRKCEKMCTICRYANEIKILILANGFYFPFFEETNCNSKNVIYLIECKRCQYYYIGETSLEIKKRLSTHLSNIRWGHTLNART